MIDPDPDAPSKECSDCEVEAPREITGMEDIGGAEFVWQCPRCGDYLGRESFE